MALQGEGQKRSVQLTSPPSWGKKLISGILETFNLHQTKMSKMRVFRLFNFWGSSIKKRIPSLEDRPGKISGWMQSHVWRMQSDLGINVPWPWAPVPPPPDPAPHPGPLQGMGLDRGGVDCFPLVGDQPFLALCWHGFIFALMYRDSMYICCIQTKTLVAKLPSRG